MDENIRLQKYLAMNGVGSRRKCEEYILDGKVTVNKKLVTELGTKVNVIKDIVYFDGKLVKAEKQEKIYVLLNKPIGYVTTAKDEFHRPIVFELLKDIDTRLVAVGRLDMYTSGALILTNDGDYVYRVTHPRNEVEKTYIAKLEGIVTEEDVEKLENGIEIEDYVTAYAKVRILKTDKKKNITDISIIIHEGKNKQVRKMCEAIDKKVITLHRSKIGNISVDDMKIGEYRFLTNKEIK